MLDAATANNVSQIGTHWVMFIDKSGFF